MKEFTTKQWAIMIGVTAAFLWLLMPCVPTQAQDYPLKNPREKPMTATLIGVCEDHRPTLMVAIFTYKDGHTMLVNSKDMQGFKDAREIAMYASTADRITDMAQTCGDTSA